MTVNREFYPAEMIEMMTGNLTDNGFGIEHAVAWAIRDFETVIESVQFEAGIHGERVGQVNFNSGTRVSFFESGVNYSYGWAVYEVYATAHDEDDGEVTRNANRYKVAEIIRNAGQGITRRAA